MAIGDNVGVMLGTATEDHQPSSGVEEKINVSSKNGTNDACSHYNGSVLDPDWMPSASQGVGSTDFFRDICRFITNSEYVRKKGSTDIMYASGVITNV